MCTLISRVHIVQVHRPASLSPWLTSLLTAVHLQDEAVAFNMDVVEHGPDVCVPPVAQEVLQLLDLGRVVGSLLRDVPLGGDTPDPNLDSPALAEDEGQDVVLVDLFLAVVQEDDTG